MRYCVFAVAAIVLFPLAAFPGTNDGQEDTQSKGEFFERKIRPLLAKHCYECHSVDTADESGRLALDGRAGLIAGGTRGPIFAAGKPDESLLVAAIRYTDPKLQMPPSGRLEDAEIELFVQWIRDGAFVPDYGTKAQKNVKEIDWDAARRFWSFVPLKYHPLPDGANFATDHQPIDGFINQKLQQNDLKPAPPADERTLVRRLSFDLLGLPPRGEEISEFVEDMRPDAYERLVDRLLASPHFGERWARYWLDLARYTDVTPSWLKNADQAWMYRDWVVRAINEDRPYDDFVKSQLAADVIENTKPEDFAALGLIGLSPTYWKELKLSPAVIEVIVADEWDERVDAVSRTFLGLTVACARCHDHKFDPLTSRDYYALAGIFASTQMTDRPLLPSPLAEQIAEARREVERLEDSLKAIADKESVEAKKLKTDIDAIRTSTPQFDAKMAHMVEDASLFVLPDGPDMTKLDVRKREHRNLPVFRRGNPGNPGEIVPRRFLEVLSAGTPQPFVSGSGRREFAESLFREGRGLSARVMVNRIWAHYFGRGLVRTPSDFGAQGDRPSHPELLEWMAVEFAGRDNLNESANWSLKRLHRRIVTSGAYRRSSKQVLTQSDPENQWLGRMSRRRLDIEPWRDSMLVASGKLDDTFGGPAAELDAPSNLRRTLYGKVGRDEQNDLLRLFDFPPPTSHSPARDMTTTPLQQLFVLNSDFVENIASALVVRIQSESQLSTRRAQIARCYQFVFQREPAEAELQLGERFLTPKDEGTASESHRWTQYVQSLFGLNELMFVD